MHTEQITMAPREVLCKLKGTGLWKPDPMCYRLQSRPKLVSQQIINILTDPEGIEDGIEFFEYDLPLLKESTGLCLVLRVVSVRVDIWLEQISYHLHIWCIQGITRPSLLLLL